MLKAIYDNESDIPADLKAYYKQGADGKWHLQVEGLIPRAKLDEFRDNNVQLQKELDALKAKYKDVDPAKYAELVQIEADLNAGKTKGGKTVDQIVEERVAEMRKQSETKVTELTQQNERLTGELSTLRINDAVLRAATAKGLRETAADDIIARARTTFKLVDGQARAFENGDKPRYNGKGEAYGIEDFVEEQLVKAAHLFKDSSGSGAGDGKGGGGNGSGNGAGLNPWKQESWNMTRQGEIIRKDRALAERLATEAGKKLPPLRAAATK